jgi:phosphohistidine phosphatase SixA/ADP-ribose pyrophosphatase YjhB (NUDIX family)
LILYFLRHGDAGEPRAADDDGRELTAQGEASLRAAAPLWRGLAVSPEVVISSPLPRALRTAELLVEAIDMSAPPVASERLRPGAHWAEMARELAAHPNARSSAFVGHDPDLAEAIGLLTGASVRLRKGGLAAVEFRGDPEPGRGQLAWLIDPDLYRTDPMPTAEGRTHGDPDRRVTRISAYALCIEEGRILLVRIAEGYWSGVGQWTLPGGGLDFGESPRDGALRELTEETGLSGAIEGLADVLSWSGRWTHPRDGADEAFHGLQIVYRVRLTGGELSDEVEGSTDQARWFTRDEAMALPLVELAAEGVRLGFASES